MRKSIHCIVLASMGALTSCAATQPTGLHASYSGTEKASTAISPALALKKGKIVKLEVFHEQVDFGETEFKLTEPAVGPTDLYKNDSRTRTGLRAGFGPEYVRGYVQVFGEKYESSEDDSDPVQDLDGFGIGVGVFGAPDVVDFSENLSLLIPYRFGFNISATDHEDSGNKTELVYAEFEAEIGVGVSIHGIQPSVGVYTQTTSGEVDFKQGGASIGKGDYDSSNTGGYAQILYQPENFPMFIRARGYGGDVEGFLVGLGASF